MVDRDRHTPLGRPFFLAVPKVDVAGDDPEAVKAALRWAKGICERLEGLDQPKQEEGQQEERETPVCAVHNVPMVWQKGRRGFFWSCHERNADGSFCSYRPDGN